MCDISGYGDDGPAYRDKKAYDLLIQSEAGLRVGHRHAATSRARPARRSPTSPPACMPTRSILAALLQRGSRPARGQHIDISMLESLVEWISYPLYYAFDGAAPPPRTGASHATIYPYGPFPAGDGRTVMLGLQNEREWVSFCEKVLLQPGACHATRASPATSSAWPSARRCARSSSRPSQPLTAAQVVERLEAAQIANARVNTMHDVWEHPQLKARDRWREVGSPAGPMPAMLPPGTWDEGAAHGPGARAGRAHRRHPGRARLRAEEHRAPARRRGLRGRSERPAIRCPHLPVRAGQPARALRQGAGQRRRRGRPRPRRRGRARRQGRRARRDREWLRARREADRARIVVRINDAAADWFADDLRCLREAGARQVMLPKAESARAGRSDVLPRMPRRAACSR